MVWVEKFHGISCANETFVRHAQQDGYEWCLKARDGRHYFQWSRLPLMARTCICRVFVKAARQTSRPRVFFDWDIHLQQLRKTAVCSVLRLMQITLHQRMRFRVASLGRRHSGCWGRIDLRKRQGTRVEAIWDPILLVTSSMSLQLPNYKNIGCRK